MTVFKLAAIGTSLGGLDALGIVLRGLARNLRLAIAVVQHRKADAGGGLIELLQSYSRLPVSEPEDKELIVPGHVYLAPANYHLLVERGRFSLSVDPPVCFARPSIDVLFESVADAYGAEAIGVVLTGASSDGAKGAAAIKRAGGRVLVQKPDTAESPIAPLATLARTWVDQVLELGDIPNALARF